MSAVGLPEVAAPEQINNMERPMHAYTVKTRSTSGAQTLCVIAPDSIAAGLMALDALAIAGPVSFFVLPAARQCAEEEVTA